MRSTKQHSIEVQDTVRAIVGRSGDLSELRAVEYRGSDTALY